MTTKPAAEPSREELLAAFETLRGHSGNTIAFKICKDMIDRLRVAPAGNTARPITEAELLPIITRARGKWASNPDPSNKDSLETFIARELSAAGLSRILGDGEPLPPRSSPDSAEVRFGFASYSDRKFELIAINIKTGEEIMLEGQLRPDQTLEQIDKVLPTCVYVTGTPAQGSFEQFKGYVERAIASFAGDPADNQFQKGFLAALEVVRDEAFTPSPISRPHGECGK